VTASGGQSDASRKEADEQAAGKVPSSGTARGDLGSFRGGHPCRAEVVLNVRAEPVPIIVDAGVHTMKQFLARNHYLLGLATLLCLALASGAGFKWY
jgi:hypothetical protein